MCTTNEVGSEPVHTLTSSSIRETVEDALRNTTALNMTSTPNLNGRRALVIGAETTTGEAIARALGKSGADVALAVLQPDEGVLIARKLQRELRAQGRHSMTYAMDVTLGRNVQVTTRQVAKELGGIDLVVSAPDELFLAPLSETSDAQLAHIMTLNGYAHAFAARSAFDEFHRKNHGMFLLVTHALGKHPLPGTAAYSLACAAANGLLRTLAYEHEGPALAAVGLLRGASVFSADYTPKQNLKTTISTTDASEADTIGRLACALAIADPSTVTGRIFSIQNEEIVNTSQ